MKKTDYWGHDRPLSTGGSLARGGGGSQSDLNTWVCLKMLCTPTPNGFADHYPY